MSAIVLAVIDEEFAKLEPIVATPRAPLGYGRDLSCVRDVTPLLDEVDENSPRGITEACIRRLSTARGEYPDGGLPEDLEYGWSILSLLSKGLSPAEIRDAAGEIQGQLLKDDRVAACSVTLRQISKDELHLEISIEPSSPELTPFAFNLVATPTGLQEAA